MNAPTLKRLRKGRAKSGPKDLGMDASFTAGMLLVPTWAVLHGVTIGDGWLGAVAAGAVGGLATFFAAALVSGMVEDTVGPRWCDAVGWHVAGFTAGGLAVALWYPWWAGLVLVGVAVGVFWPFFLQALRKADADRALGLPAVVVDALEALPEKVSVRWRKHLNGALADRERLVQLLIAEMPDEADDLIADADRAVAGVARQIGLGQRLRAAGRRPAIREAAAEVDEKAMALVHGLHGLLDAALLSIAARRDGEADVLLEEVAKLRRMTDAEAEIARDVEY